MSEDSPTRLDRRTERREVFAVIDASPVYKLNDIDHVYTVVTSHSPNGLALCTVIAGRASAPTLIGVVEPRGRSADGKALPPGML